jgi:hypothetical protein
MRLSRRVLISGVVALAALAGVLTYVFSSGGSGPHRSARPGPAAAAARHATSRQLKGPSAVGVGPKWKGVPRVSGATANTALKGVPRQPPRPPRHASHWIPWTRDGSSLVARTRWHWLAVYRRPRVRHAALLLSNPDQIGTPRVLLVHTVRRNWVRVYLPTRPNGLTGWIRRRSVRLLHNPYRIVIRLRAHRLEVWKGTRRVLHARTVVGNASTPTPLGMFYVVDLLKPPDPHGSYGPFTYDLSAHSHVLREFAGGDGHVAIHGTNQPWLLGKSVSHGCIRVSNAVIRRLARVLPLGTPVQIRR